MLCKGQHLRSWWVDRQHGRGQMTQDAFSNMVCNYTHHFMYVILIAYIISGMLVHMFTQLWSLHMTFLWAYANFITYFHMQSSEKMRAHCCMHQGLLISGAESSLSQNHMQSFQSGKNMCFGYERNYWAKLVQSNHYFLNYCFFSVLLYSRKSMSDAALI